MNSDLSTDYLPPERLGKEEVVELNGRIAASDLASWVDAIPMGVIILNSHRQIIFCNKSFKELAKTFNATDIIGLRPGEALGCIHSKLNKGGCGTSSFCRFCGAAEAILRSLRGQAHVEECHLIRNQDSRDVLDLQVFAKPVDFHEHKCMLFTAVDISHEKRLHYMERMFFHDMINIAAGVDGVTRLAEMDPNMRTEELGELLDECARKLLDDALYFKDLVAAERGRLEAMPGEIRAGDVLEAVKKSVEARFEGQGKSIIIKETCPDLLKTDRRLVGHVLRNMLVNALEEVDHGGAVGIGCQASPDSITFWTQNPGIMTDDVQAGLFKRYVSTKGEGRGLGTHIMMVFTECYLGGRIEYSSGEEGTIFKITLPKELSTPASGSPLCGA